MDNIMDTLIPTQNRFALLNELLSEPGFGENGNVVNQTPTNSVDTRQIPSNGINREMFEHSDMNNKLLYIFDELKFIRNEQVSCSRGLVTFQNSLGSVNQRLNQVSTATNFQSELLKTLVYKSIDLEARSRRNILVFRGFMENYGEDCFGLLRDFLRNRLDIDSNNVYIARAHRLGERNPNRRHNSRPIIANFRDFCDIELIMRNARMLRGSHFSINYDYPREIQEARSKLWPKYKELKQSNPRSNVQIVYPAKLLQDDRLIHDEIPEWSRYVGANRLTLINSICNVKTQQLRNPVLSNSSNLGPPGMNTPPHKLR